MEPLKIEDLIPTTGEFKLKANGGFTFTLKPFSMADEIWLKKRFGDDKNINKIFQEMDLFKIAEIAYHQLIDEHKAYFKQQKVTVYDEEGKSEEIQLGGYKLLFSMVSGWKEKKEILDALLMTIGISRPLAEKLEANNKERVESEKKTLNPQTGQEFSTFSTLNTVGEKKSS